MIRQCKLNGGTLLMARKVFQDFANVLCQKFVDLPTNMDLVNLLILGGGTLVLDITGRKATINRGPVEPLPYAEWARTWLAEQMEKHNTRLRNLLGHRWS